MVILEGTGHGMLIESPEAVADLEKKLAEWKAAK